MYKTARLDWPEHIITIDLEWIKKRFTIQEYKEFMWITVEAVLNILVDQGKPSVDIYY